MKKMKDLRKKGLQTKEITYERKKEYVLKQW